MPAARMTVQTLASGSSGNMTLVRFGRTSVLVDVGLPSMAATREALAAVGLCPWDLTAVLLSHAHSDHMSAYGLRVVEGIPVLASAQCAAEARTMWRSRFHRELPEGWFHLLASDVTCLVGDLEVTPFDLPHDVPTHGFVFMGRAPGGAGRKLVLATDLGCAPDRLLTYFTDADVVVLEANYNEVLLRQSPRSAMDKARVRSDRGHLGNVDAGRFLGRVAAESQRLPAAVVLAHLSRDHNRPDLAVSDVTAHAHLGNRMPPTAAAPPRSPGPEISV